MWKRLSFVCVCLLFLGGPSFALNINDLIRGGIQKGMREATLFEWRKLPTAELACIDQNLHRQGWSIDALAIQGIGPPDSRLAQLRADCRNQFAQIPQGNPAASSPYVVDGLSLGGQVQPNSQAYQRYQCGPSDKFPGFTWCHGEHTTSERGNEITLSHSILHSQDGTAFYVNSYREPAFFGPNDIQNEIHRLSQRFGQQPRLIQMPRREGLPNAVMAIWGGIELQQLTSDEISTVASGRSVPGLSVSFLGDVQRSAKAGVPIYRLAGHAGFLWVATYNSSGRGVLRYLAMDRSKIGSKIENPDQLANPASPARLHAPTPSFDCAKASMADELVICSNSELAELNKAIATGYEFVRSANGDLIVKQIDAPLSQARQACGSDFTCIKDQQIAAVNTYQNRGAPVKVSMWNLDGSEMILIVNGQSRKFFYDIPRPELISAGARSGSIAFDGRAISQQYVGTAYLFDSMCGQNGYQVSGPILDNYERVVLQGPAPQLTQNCIPQGYSTATLDFKLNTGSSIANPLGPNLNVTPNRSAASISPPTPNVTPSTPTPSPPASPATPNVTPSTPTPSPSVSPSPPAPKPPVSSAPRQYQSTTSPATAFEISPLAILFLVYVFVAGVVTWRSVRRWNLWNGIFIGAWGSSFIENLIRLILYRIGFELFIFGMACIFGALGGWIFVVLKVVNEKKQAQPA